MVVVIAILEVQCYMSLFNEKEKTTPTITTTTITLGATPPHTILEVQCCRSRFR